MAQRKRKYEKKRPNENYRDYVDKIEAGTEEGDFREFSLTSHLDKDEEVKRMVHEMELEVLFKDGNQTMHVRCRNRKCTYKVDDQSSSEASKNKIWNIGDRDTLYKRALITGHYNRRHGKQTNYTTKKGRKNPDTNLDPNQSQLSFGPRFTDKESSKRVKKSAIRVIADQNLPMSFFEADSVKNYIRTVLSEVKVDPNHADKYTYSARTLGRELVTTSSAHCDVIKKFIEYMAPEGIISIAIDHKEVSKYTSDYSGTCLGVQMTKACLKTKKYTQYLLAFAAVDFKDDVTTAEYLEDILSEYNMLESVRKGQIGIVSDAAASGVAEFISPSYGNRICNDHSFDKLMKNTVQGSQSKTFNKDSENKFKKFRKFLINANTPISKREKKKRKLKYRGINDYFQQVIPDRKDKIAIAETKPNWISKFSESENEEVELSENEQKEKKRILDSITQYPLIPVSIL